MTIGSKVICVDDAFPLWVYQVYAELPFKGSAYTVRSVFLAREAPAGGSEEATVGILLYEIKNPPDDLHVNGQELGFREERFRVVEEVQQEVGIKFVKQN